MNERETRVEKSRSARREDETRRVVRKQGFLVIMNERRKQAHALLNLVTIENH